MSGLSFSKMNEWRMVAQQLLCEMAEQTNYQCTVINPCDFYNFEKIEYQSQEEVMDYDLYHVKHSDFVIVNGEGLSTSVGTQIEIYEAWSRGIPVFVFGDDPLYLHPWIVRCVTRFEDNIEDVVEYLRKFYFV